MNIFNSKSKKINGRKKTKNTAKKSLNAIDELKKLADTLDPYAGPNAKEIKILSKYGITEYADPFKLTNEVLFLMENLLEEEMSNKKPDSTLPVSENFL